MKHLFHILAATACLFVCGCATKQAPYVPPGPDPGPIPPAYLTPPAEHPRLFVRASDIPGLKEKVKSAEGQSILNRLKALSVPRTPAEEAAVTDHGYRYYFEMRGKTSEVQLQALDYLLHGNEEAARNAITSILDSLKHTSFGTQDDLSRASGVMLTVGAMVYDWCYDKLSLMEKSQFITNFKRIAGTMECGYPPKGKDYICGHASEWMILRDLLSAGIAVYDEDPEIYDKVLELLTQKYIPARNFTYRGGAYHQGTNYISVRFGNDLISMWIFAKMGFGNIYSDDIRTVPYDIIYRYRPDGQVLPSGDTNPNRRANHKSYPLIGMLAGSYFKDPHIEYIYDFKPETENHCLMLELLWRDFGLKGEKPDDLPAVRYCSSPFGWMTARTGWGTESAIVEMKIGEKYYGNHQHLDAGAFQIYYKGPLAIDSGTYQGTSGDYGSPHCKNYFKRTIAHNSLLIYNPSERFSCINYGGSPKTEYASNDGGQRMPKGWMTCASLEDLESEEYTTGKVLSHWTDGTDALLDGDITQAYSSSKAGKVQRSFFFVNNRSVSNPAALIVFDRVASKDASYRKYFLLHCIEEPTVNGRTFDIRRTKNGDSGKLHCTSLLPADASTMKVGGPGKEFWVFGENFPNERSDEAGESGSWRVEITPGADRKEDLFLNVLEICDGNASPLCTPSYFETGQHIGVNYGKNLVLFSRSGMNVSDRINLSVAEDDTVLSLCGLTAGNWTVYSGNGTHTSIKVNENENVLRTKMRRGDYQIWKD